MPPFSATGGRSGRACSRTLLTSQHLRQDIYEHLLFLELLSILKGDKHYRKHIDICFNSDVLNLKGGGAYT